MCVFAVDSHVCLQIGFLVEPFPTNITAEGVFARVDPDVHLEV